MPAASIITELKKLFFSGTAIYIGDDFVDIAQADQTLKGIHVTYLQRFPLLKKIGELASSDEKEAIDRILERAFPDEKQRPHRVAVNLRNDAFLLRRFLLKEIPENEIRHAVVFEAQKYIPYPIDDLVYGIRSCVRKREYNDVVFAAAETKFISVLLEYFKAKGMLPGVIEPSPLLIARAVSMEAKIKKDASYVVIHYEPANKVIITEVFHGCAYSFREVRIFPGEEEFKTSELVYHSLKDVFPLIQNDLIGSTEFLHKETKQPVEKIFVSGFAPSPDEGAISAEFGIPFERIGLSFLKGEDAAIENKDRYLPALALLHDSISRPFLNLVPPEIASRDVWALKALGARMAVALAAIIAMHMVFVGINASWTKRIEKVKESYQIYKVISPDATRQDILRYKNILEERARFVDGILAKRVSLTEKLTRLGQDITPNSWIDDVTYENAIDKTEGPTMKLAGAIYAGKGAGIQDAKSILESIKEDEAMMGGFQEVKLGSVKKQKYLEKEITEFEITLD